MSVRCPCGEVILADTEDWPTPMCPNHAESLEKMAITYAKTLAMHGDVIWQVTPIGRKN